MSTVNTYDGVPRYVTGLRPSLTALDPDSVEHNSGAQTIELTGTGFQSGAVALFNGLSRDTTFISSVLLEMELEDDDTDIIDTFPVVVVNPNGISSNSLDFDVTEQLWTPAEIATEWWLDASDALTITTASGGVSQWNDKSGNTRHVTQGSSGNRPDVSAAAINGLDTILFDGVDDAIGAALAVLQLSQSVYIVIKPTIEAAVGSVLAQYNAVSAGRMTFQCNSDLAGAASSGNFHYFINSVTSGAGSGGQMLLSSITNAATLLAWTVNTGSENWKTYKNGTLNDSATITSFYTGASTLIGALPGFTEPYDGLVAEIVVVSGIQAQADREIMEGYLAWKWGFQASLPGGHPYLGGPPEV